MIPDDAAPDGAGYCLGWFFYKDAAPMALQSALKNHLTMEAKKITIRLGQFFR